MVESWGRGISNILKECTLAGIPEPYFDLEMGGVDVRFFPRAVQESTEKMSGETTTQEMSEKMSEKVLELIKIDSKITTGILAKELNVTSKTIERAIKVLKSENKIERIGPDKGGYWQIKN
jgi:ATP-dependent DNA helicase RecG